MNKIINNLTDEQDVNDKNTHFNLIKSLIAFILSSTVNLIFIFLSHNLGYNGKFYFLIPLFLYDYHMFYSSLINKNYKFNKIYFFMLGLCFLPMDFNFPISDCDNNSGDIKELREFNFDKSKVIYIFGNLSILFALYYIILSISCETIFSNTLFTIVIVQVVLSYIFLSIYSSIYNTFSLDVLKFYSLQIILTLLIVIFTILLLAFSSVDKTLLIVFNSYLLLLVLTMKNKKNFHMFLLLGGIIIFVIIGFIIYYIFR